MISGYRSRSSQTMQSLPVLNGMTANSNPRGEERLSVDKCFQDFERGASAGDQRCKDEVSKLIEPQQYSLLDWSKSSDLIAVVAFGQASTCDDKPDIASIGQ